MHLVYDIDFILSAGGGIARVIDYTSYVIYGVIRCTVYFDYIDGASFDDRTAGFAFVAGFVICLWISAVNRASENACGGGFSHSAWSAK